MPGPQGKAACTSRLQGVAAVLTGLLTALSLTLASLFPIMNPLAALPVFVSLTGDEGKRTRARTALRTAVAVGVVLVVSTLVGRPLLSALGITLPALQLAGGLVVAISALRMVNGDANQLRQEEHGDGAKRPDPSITPLAIPLLAGPGAIGVVIAVSSRADGLESLLGVLLGVVVMALAVFIALRFGDPLVERLGASGIGVMTRIFGLLLLAIAVELVSTGVAGLVQGS